MSTEPQRALSGPEFGTVIDSCGASGTDGAIGSASRRTHHLLEHRYGAVIAMTWGMLGAVQIMNDRHPDGIAIFLLMTLLVIGISLRPRSPQDSILRFTDHLWKLALAIICLIQTGYLVNHLRHPHIVDIGQSTLTAGKLMVAGRSPYVFDSDPIAVGSLAQSLGAAAAAHYDGYKYLPIMPVAYMPLGSPFGVRGLILTNALLMATLLAATWKLSNKISGVDAARWSVFLLGTLTLPIFQLYGKGVTDIVPVLPLIVALIILEGRPGMAGVLVGLSLSAKLVPALLVFPLFLPFEQDKRVRYIFGILLILVPSVLYALETPRAFFDNIFYFNAIRPIDSTSWMSGRSASLIFGVHAIFVGFWVSTIIIVASKSLSARTRSGLAAMLLAAVILAGPVMHENYMLWVIPFLVVFVSTRGSVAADPSATIS